MGKVKTIKGHQIRRLKDVTGGHSYFVYDLDGRQILERYDTQEAAEAALNEYLG